MEDLSAGGATGTGDQLTKARLGMVVSGDELRDIVETCQLSGVGWCLFYEIEVGCLVQHRDDDSQVRHRRSPIGTITSKLDFREKVQNERGFVPQEVPHEP